MKSLFLKYPLFGKDSSPLYTSHILALFGTFIFIFLFLLLCILIKPKKNETKYKTVQIVLASNEKKQESLDGALASSTDLKGQEEVQKSVADKKDNLGQEKSENLELKKDSNKKENIASSSKKVETNEKSSVKSSSENKKNPVKTSEAKSIPEKVPLQQEYAKSVEELMEEQARSVPKKAKNFDWSMFDDEDNGEEFVSDVQTKSFVKNEFSGSAASAKENDSSLLSSQSLKSSEGQSLSKNTSDSLNAIANTISVKFSSSGLDAQSDIKVNQRGRGKYNFEMADGSSRSLIEPEKPVIKIERTSHLIDSSKKVTITFLVNEKGYVPSNLVQVYPESLLPLEVRKEIIEQISKWRFEEDVLSASASFDFSIVKK